MVTTRVAKVDSLDPTGEPAIREAAELIRAGALVAFPTETVYGLGANALDYRAVEEIFRAKGRPSDNPIIVHVADLAGIDEVAVVAASTLERLAALWPGPLTVVLRARPHARAASRGLDTVAVRIPAHPVALALISVAARPIAAPSANLSGRPSPTSARHVLDDLGGSIPLILDSGQCIFGIESTVIDLSDGQPMLLRPGATPTASIEELLGQRLLAGTADSERRSPGTRYRHYSPQAPIVVIGEDVSVHARHDLIERIGVEVESLARSTSRNYHVGYITKCDAAAPHPNVLQRYRADACQLAHHLFADFRDLDDPSALTIIVDGVASDEAVMDRVMRAAAVKIMTDIDATRFTDTAHFGAILKGQYRGQI